MRYFILCSFLALFAYAPGQAASAGEKISYQRKLDDSRIENRFSDGLRRAGRHLDKKETRVRSYNGYVLLYGRVDNAALKAAAEKHATSLEGVRRVFNQLKVGVAQPNWFNQFALNAIIRSNLLTASTFDGSRIKFESFHNVVYLMGLVSSAEAADAVDLVSSINDVDEIVTLFEYTD